MSVLCVRMVSELYEIAVTSLPDSESEDYVSISSFLGHSIRPFVFLSCCFSVQFNKKKQKKTKNVDDTKSVISFNFKLRLYFLNTGKYTVAAAYTKMYKSFKVMCVPQLHTSVH